MHSEVLRLAAINHIRDIMPPYDAIMELEGFDAICAFSEMLGGATVYVPNKKTIFLHCLEKEAMREFNGANYAALTRKYGLSESHLRKLQKR